MCQNQFVQHCMRQIHPEWNDCSTAERRYISWTSKWPSNDSTLLQWGQLRFSFHFCLVYASNFCLTELQDTDFMITGQFGTSQVSGFLPSFSSPAFLFFSLIIFKPFIHDTDEERLILLTFYCEKNPIVKRSARHL